MDQSSIGPRPNLWARLQCRQAQASLLAPRGSMIHRYVFHNQRVLPIEEVRLSPGQAGLLSGWGLFTTLRITEGEAFAFERHWRRLEKDAARTRVPFPF